MNPSAVGLLFALGLVYLIRQQFEDGTPIEWWFNPYTEVLQRTVATITPPDGVPQNHSNWRPASEWEIQQYGGSV